MTSEPGNSSLAAEEEEEEEAVAPADMDANSILPPGINPCPTARRNSADEEELGADHPH